MAQIKRISDSDVILKLKSGKERKYSRNSVIYDNPKKGDIVRIRKDENGNITISLIKKTKKSHKLLAVILILFSVFAIWLLWPTDSDTSSNNEEITPIPSGLPETVIKTPASADQPIYEDDTIAIYYKGLSEFSDVPDTVYINFIYENKTDNELTLYPTDAVINNTTLQLFAGMTLTMQPHTQTVQSLFSTFANAGISSIDEITTIRLKFTDFEQYTSNEITITAGQ